MDSMMPRKEPGVAAVLSFFWGGLGQIYCEKVTRGLVIISVQIINAFLILALIGLITFPLVWMWNIYDAYKLAEKNNQLMAEQQAKTVKEPIGTA